MLVVFLKEFFEKVEFEKKKSTDDKKAIRQRVKLERLKIKNAIELNR